MEKFGIFELLDALAALTNGENSGSSFPNSADPPSPVTEPASKPPHAPSNADAFTSFLERHNRIAEDIDRKKK